MKRGRYRIQVVTQRTGLPAATLRAWERRYGFPVPERSPSSTYRLYSEQDISDLLTIKEMCEQGHSPSEAVKLLLDQREEAQEEAQEEPQEEPQGDVEGVSRAHQAHQAHHTQEQTPQPQSGQASALGASSTSQSTPQHLTSRAVVRERLMEATRRFDPVALESAIRGALLVGSARDVFHEVFAPVLRAVGEEWHEGTLSIAQEHLASELIGNATRDLLRTVQRDQGPRVVLACVSEEQHVLPLYGSAFHFIQWGFRVTILGANTPPEGLISACDLLKPDVVGLSVTQLNPLFSEQLSRYAEACAGRPWVVGGASAAHYQEQVEALGGLVAVGDPSALQARLLASLG